MGENAMPVAARAARSKMRNMAYVLFLVLKDSSMHNIIIFLRSRKRTKILCLVTQFTKGR